MRSTMPAEALESSILRDVRVSRRSVAQHPIYEAIDSVERLAIFMESHVFAVWDFMTLVKTLQAELTCVRAPWVPQEHRTASRFINEIVLGEESDDVPGFGPISHFELYRRAMHECGADTSRIDAVVAAVRRGEAVEQTLLAAGVPKHVRAFVDATMDFAASGKPHVVAAAFSHGREDLIPTCFRSFIAALDVHFTGRYDALRTYFVRHVDIDESVHGPMASRMLHELCGDDSQRWEEARAAALAAVEARKRFWDGILAQIDGLRPHTSGPPPAVALRAPADAAFHHSQPEATMAILTTPDLKTPELTQTEVKDFLNTWARAYDDGSAKFFDYFAPSASIFTLSSPTRIDGREEFKRGFEPYLENGKRRSQILSPSIDVHGDTAVVTFHNRVSVDGAITNTRATVIVVKDADGRLQISHLHQSPLGTPAISPMGAVSPNSVTMLEERVATAASVVGTPK